MQARDYRELQRHAPIIVATLARVGESPSYGRAVILGQLGRCFHMGRRPDLAVACAREAIGITATLAPSDGVKGLGGALHSDLGDALRAIGQDAAATKAYEAALKIAEELQDLRGQAHASQRLGRNSQQPAERNEAAAFEVTLYEDLMTDYVFETDLLVDGPRQQRIVRWSEETDPPADDVRPVLLPCTRTWLDDEGAVRFGLAVIESRSSNDIPAARPCSGSAVRLRCRRIRRLLWRLIREMDGTTHDG